MALADHNAHLLGQSTRHSRLVRGLSLGYVQLGASLPPTRLEHPMNLPTPETSFPRYHPRCVFSALARRLTVSAAAICLALCIPPGLSSPAGGEARPMHAPNLKGNGHTQDSFSLIVHEAARLLAVETDYETIHALSGNAFAPAINTGENCSWDLFLHRVKFDDIRTGAPKNCALWKIK